MIRKGAPDATSAFALLSTAATTAHAIGTKTRELMALAICMGGGPAAVHGADALQAHDQFAAVARGA